MSQFIKRTCVLIAACVFTYTSHAQSSNAALTKYFGPTSLTHNAKGVSVEVCFDTCDFYQFAPSAPDDVVWDAVFIHQYYFNAAYHTENFRNHYPKLISELVKRYAALCPSVSEDKLAACIVKTLASRYQGRYYFVRYDEGYRCQSEGDFTNSHVLKKSLCRKYKTASAINQGVD
jgi:hypothetical protein